MKGVTLIFRVINITKKKDYLEGGGENSQFILKILKR